MISLQKDTVDLISRSGFLTIAICAQDSTFAQVLHFTMNKFSLAWLDSWMFKVVLISISENVPSGTKEIQFRNSSCTSLKPGTIQIISIVPPFMHYNAPRSFSVQIFFYRSFNKNEKFSIWRGIQLLSSTFHLQNALPYLSGISESFVILYSTLTILTPDYEQKFNITTQNVFNLRQASTLIALTCHLLMGIRVWSEVYPGPVEIERLYCYLPIINSYRLAMIF